MQMTEGSKPPSASGTDAAKNVDFPPLFDWLHRPAPGGLHRDAACRYAM
jgi:hypothetical protein